jgi:hypothetical protein
VLPRKKEWEHYALVSPTHAMSVTLFQIGYLAAGIVDLVDFRTGKSTENIFFRLRNLGLYKLPLNPYGDTFWEFGGDSISFSYAKGQRTLEFDLGFKLVMPGFSGKIILEEPQDTISVVRPFESEGEFFYETKIPDMKVSGSAWVGGKEYRFDPNNSRAILDWGRGVWPATGKWYWGHLFGKAHGQDIALNLSYGYGDDSQGTVNALFVNGKMQKLDHVEFQFNPSDRKKPWKIVSNDGRVRLRFKPTTQQHVNLDVLVKHAKLDRVFGRAEGEIVLDDGQVVKVDGLLGFLEEFRFQW